MPSGTIVVDKLDFHLMLPTKELDAGAIALEGMTRFYTPLPSGRRRPALTHSAIVNTAENKLRHLMKRKADPNGDTWEWRATSYPPPDSD